jgi:hypothetical protein
MNHEELQEEYERITDIARDVSCVLAMATRICPPAAGKR